MTFLTPPTRSLPSKILIANRGEIAVRIARACSDLGIRSVAVYSPSDRDALHVNIADEAFALAGDQPDRGYLDIDQILAIADRSGADAVHPGYGFLAENADFAERSTAAGLTWIGPSPVAIRQLGDKLEARALAAAVGAPLVAGTADPVEDVAEVLAFADEHGFPIAIKAAYGGGGRGIKVVYDRVAIPEAFESAVREAQSAFGRGECFVECFLAAPRHIETQCLADEHGNVAVLSTRDCSLQRRNQKIVEEAPAPTLTEDKLTQLREASAAILKAAQYVGAGTCEFLVDGDRITFLEVNTRIQVEHPVTEEVTGVDLITAMIEVASGAAVAEVPAVRGHSLEFRINAENVAEGFIPSPGTITTLRWPQGPGVRVDTGYREGDTIPTAYDSLIAKLIITAETRDAAIRRAQRALAETVVEGVPTTLDFHRDIVAERIFVEDAGAGVYTRWIDTSYTHTGVSTTPAAVRGSGDRTRIVAEVDGRRLVVTLPASNSLLHHTVTAEPVQQTETTKTSAPDDDSPEVVRSQMAGSVVGIAVDVGALVRSGDTIVTMEAMKMEQPVRAPFDGVVSDIAVAVGDQLTAGAPVCKVVAQ